MSQIVFKLNQKPSYSERMTDARAELRRLIKEQLSECLAPGGGHHHIPSARQ